MKELIEEIVCELLRFDIEELEQLQKEWVTEFELVKASDEVRKLCAALLNAVLEYKREGAAA